MILVSESASYKPSRYIGASNNHYKIQSPLLNDIEPNLNILPFRDWIRMSVFMSNYQLAINQVGIIPFRQSLSESC